MDGGGASGNYKETDFTMDISKKVKSNLEKAGVTVVFTYDEGDIDKKSLLWMSILVCGRAVIPNEVKSKYTFLFILIRVVLLKCSELNYILLVILITI